METNSPNKFFDALAAGKMIITNTKGWVKDIVEKEEYGFYYGPDEPKDFVTSVRPFIKPSNQLKDSQVNARKVAETRFAKSAQVEKLIELISV